jgi:hypothetical protein
MHLKPAFLVTVESAVLALALSGCSVVTVVDTAVSVTASTVGLAADAAIGTARIAGKVVGAAADAALGGSQAVEKSATR